MLSRILLGGTWAYGLKDIGRAWARDLRARSGLAGGHRRLRLGFQHWRCRNCLNSKILNSKILRLRVLHASKLNTQLVDLGLEAAVLLLLGLEKLQQL